MPYYVVPPTMIKGMEDLRLRPYHIANTFTTGLVVFVFLKCTGGWLANRSILGIAGLAAYNHFMTDPEMRGCAEDTVDHGLLVNPNPQYQNNRIPNAVLLDPESKPSAGPVRDR